MPRHGGTVSGRHQVQQENAPLGSPDRQAQKDATERATRPGGARGQRPTPQRTCSPAAAVSRHGVRQPTGTPLAYGPAPPQSQPQPPPSPSAPPPPPCKDVFEEAEGGGDG